MDLLTGVFVCCITLSQGCSTGSSIWPDTAQDVSSRDKHGLQPCEADRRCVMKRMTLLFFGACCVLSQLLEDHWMDCISHIPRKVCLITRVTAQSTLCGCESPKCWSVSQSLELKALCLKLSCLLPAQTCPAAGPAYDFTYAAS